jgi:hypothetical protein
MAIVKNLVAKSGHMRRFTLDDRIRDIKGIGFEAVERINLAQV